MAKTIARTILMRLYNAMSTIEKRRYARLPVSLPVLLRHCGRIIPATAMNLSCGGMYLKMDSSSIQSDHPVEVIFDLGDDERDVAMRGQIMRLDKSEESFGIGVQFTNIFSVSHKAVEHYLNKHLN